MKRWIWTFVCLFFAPAIWAQNHPQIDREKNFFENGQWANYGNNPGGMGYSPLKQINTANASQLKLAWTYHTGELKTYENTRIGQKAAFETTPLMVNGVLYFSTPTNRVIALSAEKGEELWTFNPKVNLQGGYSEITSRGVSKWIDSSLSPEDDDYLRILIATIDGRLIALNAKDGQPVNSFGENGTIDLTEGIGRIQVTSPPAVINDLIVIGSVMGDNQNIDYPSGAVRAYDARSGKLRWSWDPIPTDPEDPAYKAWDNPDPSKSGAANAWAPLSADPARDLVFVPTSSPSPDYYGGERKGHNNYANSLVALKASTGKVVWHFQAVHHDLWDFDVPAQPVLFDLEKDGEMVPAVAIVTKMGHIFVFNRENGEAMFPIEERPVPKSDVPGEETATTQPFPAQLPLLGLRKITKEDAWGPTPELKAKAEKRIAPLRNEGIFTPPSFEGTIMTPSNVGGMNWSGACFDPERQLLITNVNYLAALITLYPRDKKQINEIRAVNQRAEIGRQTGSPYVMTRDYLFEISSQGLIMQTKPPWGTLAAIDLKTGKLSWEVPLGIMMDPGKFPEAVNWGSLSLGGAMCTAGGLTFIAGTLDGFFRAFDSQTGKMLWGAQLPAGGHATPMSYQVNGKQYVLVAAGGHGKLGTPLGDQIMVYALE